MERAERIDVTFAVGPEAADESEARDGEARVEECENDGETVRCLHALYLLHRSVETSLAEFISGVVSPVISS